MTGDGLLALLGPSEIDHVFGWPDAVLIAATVVTCGIVTVVDLRERIIPDGCNLALAGLGLAWAGLDGGAAVLAAAVQGLAAFAAFFLFRALYRGLRGRHGLGLGDVKFLGAAGAWVGLASLPPLLLLACGTALAALGIARWRGQAVSASLALPFGPFLVVGFFGALALRFA